MNANDSNDQRTTTSKTSQSARDNCSMTNLNKDYQQVSLLMQELQSQVERFVTTAGTLVENASAPANLANLFESQLQNVSENKIDNFIISEPIFCIK